MSRRSPLRSQPVFGGVFIAIGVGLIALMTLSPEGLEVPYWVGVVASATFVFAGLSVGAQAMARPLAGRLFAVFAVLCLAAPGLWILFEPATAQCTARVGATSLVADDLMCRAVFGFGGVVTLAVALFAAVVFVRRLRTGRAMPAETGGEAPAPVADIPRDAD